MINLKKNNLGYTLVEIVTTTAIIGSLTAVAVPNFLRVKMNVNMEMVKQHLKVIGQEMNELYNEANPHEFPADILGLDGDPEEELSITASLNGIYNKGYTTDGYRLGAGRSNYVFTTYPQGGLLNIAGVNCFRLTPMGVSEHLPWECGAADLLSLTNRFTDNFFNYLLNDPNLTDQDKADVLAGFFKQLSFLANYMADDEPGIMSSALMGTGEDPEGKMPSFNYWVSQEDKDAFEAIFPRVSQTLSEDGINISRSAGLTRDFGGGEWGYTYTVGGKVEIATYQESGLVEGYKNYINNTDAFSSNDFLDFREYVGDYDFRDI